MCLATATTAIPNLMSLFYFQSWSASMLVVTMYNHNPEHVTRLGDEGNNCRAAKLKSCCSGHACGPIACPDKAHGPRVMRYVLDRSGDETKPRLHEHESSNDNLHVSPSSHVPRPCRRLTPQVKFSGLAVVLQLLLDEGDTQNTQPYDSAMGLPENLIWVAPNPPGRIFETSLEAV